MSNGYEYLERIKQSCSRCDHHSRKLIFFGEYMCNYHNRKSYEDACGTEDLVTGKLMYDKSKPVPCSVARGIGGFCGPEGTHFDYIPSD